MFLILWTAQLLPLSSVLYLIHRLSTHWSTSKIFIFTNDTILRTVNTFSSYVIRNLICGDKILVLLTWWLLNRRYIVAISILLSSFASPCRHTIALINYKKRFLTCCLLLINMKYHSAEDEMSHVCIIFLRNTHKKKIISRPLSLPSSILNNWIYLKVNSVLPAVTISVSMVNVLNEVSHSLDLPLHFPIWNSESHTRFLQVNCKVNIFAESIGLSYLMSNFNVNSMLLFLFTLCLYRSNFSFASDPPFARSKNEVEQKVPYRILVYPT